jgi:carbamoyl-phosphate synthase large subunit
LYVLEANPRASRTVPLVSKVCNVQMARIATQLMLGARIRDLDLRLKKMPHYGVKESVFPFDKMPEVDPVLGPEMRSTGEVLGMDKTFGQAFFKAEEAATPPLPVEGTVLISLSDKDASAAQVGRQFAALGFRILATEGTRRFFAEHNIPCDLINKLHAGRPNILDVMTNKGIDLVINTPVGKQSQQDDSYIRKAAIRMKVPYITTLTAALAAAKGIAAYRSGRSGVKSLQAYHAT